MRNVTLGLLVLALAGCQSYRARPLNPDEILKNVDKARKGTGPVVSLAQALELMRKHNPRVKEAHAAFLTARATADIKTPLANPTVTAGPLLVSGPGIFGSARYGVEATFGWAFSLSGRRKLTDELNQFLAESARIDAGAAQREEYLELRREYIALALASRRVAAQSELTAALDASVRTTRRLREASEATALDQTEVELEAGKSKLAEWNARDGMEEARAATAARTGVRAEAFSDAIAPALPNAVPELGALRKLLLRDHSGLARLRAAYEAAEKRLELEIARQYPDLEIGGGYERETGNDTYSLGFGIEVPLFDRNQRGIAEAKARRQEVRVRFEAEVGRALAAIEAARTRLVSRRKRLEFVNQELAPAATKALAMARRALEAGSADAMRFLSAVRISRELTLEQIEAERSVYEAWSDLERACGAPLLSFDKDKS